MMQVLPGKGLCMAKTMQATQTEFFSIGPLGEGTWLRRVRFHWSVDGAATLYFGAGLGGVNEESATAYDAATAFVSPSEIRESGKPGLGVITAGAANGWLEMPVGVRITSGSRWVNGVIRNIQGTAIVYVNISVESLEMVREPKEPGQG